MRERLRGLGYEMRLEKDARRFIIDHGYDEKYGARPLKRAIQTYLEDGLSEFLMSGKARKSTPIRISLNEKEELQFQQLKVFQVILQVKVPKWKRFERIILSNCPVGATSGRTAEDLALTGQILYGAFHSGITQMGKYSPTKRSALYAMQNG